MAGAEGDALVEVGAIAGEDDAAGGWERAGLEGRAEGGGGLAGEEGDFEGALDVARVAEIDGGGGGGVEVEETGDGGIGREGVDFVAEGLVGWGERGEGVGEGLEVKPAAAGDDGGVAAGEDVGDDWGGEGGEAAGVHGGAEGDGAVEVVWGGCEVGGVGLGGEDGEPGEELEGVGADDFAADGGGETGGGGAFA